MPLTDLQKTQIAYAHFTLEEWRLLVRCVDLTYTELFGTKEAIDAEMMGNMLAKFPSAVL